MVKGSFRIKILLKHRLFSSCETLDERMKKLFANKEVICSV